MIKKQVTDGAGYYGVNDPDLAFTALTREEEFELFARCRRGDEEAREKIIQVHLLFVATQAQRHAPKWLPEDEAISAGNLGLLKALVNFDHTRNFRFSSYLRKFVRGEVIAACRTHNPVDLPNNKSLPPASDVPAEPVADVDLSENHCYEEEEHGTYMSNQIQECLQDPRLTGMERAVLQRAYFRNESYSEIAEEFKKSRERIRQIHVSALEKLRACLQERGISRP